MKNDNFAEYVMVQKGLLRNFFLCFYSPYNTLNAAALSILEKHQQKSLSFDYHRN